MQRMACDILNNSLLKLTVGSSLPFFGSKHCFRMLSSAGLAILQPMITSPKNWLLFDMLE